MGSITLYHGSNAAIERPEVARNTGFADLGQGFYLTDDYDAACGRACSRARRAGGVATVSVFQLDEACVPWATWGADGPALAQSPDGRPFGLRFEASSAGIAAWASYIKGCRVSRTEVPGLGCPAVVRAWIATEEVEMACAGLVSAEDLAEVLDPAELVVQYCLLDQALIDAELAFVRAEQVG